jgi:hypothetical protein
MAKLFEENLGKASDSRELAKLKNKFSSFHPSYVALATMTTRPELRKFIESIWKQYQPYADTNFTDEFRTQFNQRAWELYLGATLINHGYALRPHSNKGPDIGIGDKEKTIWVEAIAVEKGDSQDKVPEIEYGKEMDVPENKMLLRLTSGLKEKYQKYQTYIENGTIGQEDPFIVALDRSPLEHIDPQIPLILKCLFAIGHQVLLLKSSKPHKIPDGSTWSSRFSLNKISGSKVEMFIFGSNLFDGVSAVIYTDKNVLNSPQERDKMGNNFTIVHNPYAKNPIPDNFFKFGQIWKKVGDQLKKIK